MEKEKGIEWQYNEVSKKPYEGRNQGELLAVKQDKKYKSNAWLTFLQARELGLMVKKGSKGVSIFKGFASFEEAGKDKEGKSKLKVVSRPVGFARVFNLDQTEKFEDKGKEVD